MNVSTRINWDVPPENRWQEDDTGHQYYRNNDRLRADMRAVLDGTDGSQINGRKAADGRGFILA